MEVKNVFLSVSNALKTELFKIGDAVISPASLLVFLLVLLIAMFISKLARRAITRFFANKDVKTRANADILKRVVHYSVMLVGTVASLQVVGIDLSTIFAAGAVFAVGLGFAMQNISQNFVSGLILLFERTIKQGDVIEVDERVVRVERIGIRSTLVRTRNEEELIVPNANLVQSVVKNYTLSDSLYLISADVGVAYNEDMRKVRAVLEETATKAAWRDRTRDPRILLNSFGDSSVNFSVYVFVQDPWAARRLTSDLNEAVWFALKEANITIAFPQMDVHFDPVVEASLERAPAFLTKESGGERRGHRA